MQLPSDFKQLPSGFMQLAATCYRDKILHFYCLFAEKYYSCIRMGITIFKMLIWGGISSDIRSKIMVYGSASMSPCN